MSVFNFLHTRTCAFLTAGAACMIFATSALAVEYVSVKTDKVNVRTGPGTGNPIYMELFEGYPLKVLSKKGEWLKITDYESDSGWIHASLVEKNNTVIINTNKSVNMRSGPSTQNPVVADVERGVVMTKVSTKGKWLQVRHSSGTVGWIYKPLLWP